MILDLFVIDWTTIGTLIALATGVTGIMLNNKQLKETKAIQAQNVCLQLFEKRQEIFKLFTAWHFITKRAFSNSVIDPRSGGLLGADKAFAYLFFGDVAFIDTTNPNEQVINCSTLLLRSLRNEQTGEQISIQNQLRYNIDKLSAATNFASETSLKLHSIKHLFSNVEFDKISNFIGAFIAMANNLSQDNLKSLEMAFKGIEEANVLQLLENQLNISD